MNLLLQIILLLALLAVITIFSLAESRKWYEKWPAIDDDEFLARCPPGTDREVALKVRRIVAEQTGIEYGHVYPEQSFVDDLDCC